MTIPHKKKWEDLTGDEKVAWKEFRREQRSQYSDSEYETYLKNQSARQRRIKKHTTAILKLRAS